MLKLWKESVGGVSEKDGLLAHRLFWLCILGPILLAVLLAGTYGLFSLPLERSISGVENFYQNAKFFLAIAALSIPLGATFSRIHSSSQNAKNIILSSKQNNFRNGIDHARFFEEQLAEYCEEKGRGSSAYQMNYDPFFYYKILFPYSMEGDFDNLELETTVDQLFISIAEHCASPGDISAAEKVSKNIDAIFIYLEVSPWLYGLGSKQRDSLRTIQPPRNSGKEKEIVVPEIIAEHFYIENIISELHTPFTVWKFGLDLVDHNLAYFLKQSLMVLDNYKDNFLIYINSEITYDKIQDMSLEEIDGYINKLYSKNIQDFKENGNNLKNWVEETISDNS